MSLDHHRFQRAQHMLETGQVDAAIDLLTHLLGEHPEDADSHALLALALLRRKRLHAAQLEARSAAEIEPESVFVHLALGSVLIAQRRFPAAESHLQTALELDPNADLPHAQLARLYDAWGKPKKAMQHALRACELAPDKADNWALRGAMEYDAGNRAAAREHALTALQIDPEHLDALVLAGHCDLAAGDVESARDNAIWALQSDPTDSGALTLLGAIKARKSLLLGLWWRFQSFASAGSNQRLVLILVAMYLAYRVALITLQNQGLPHWTTPVSVLWLLFCVYTWFAPSLFWKSVKREMQTVTLKQDY